ncbi:hypothetical protein ACFV4N_18685 [Actinosynnema sp. NPDC059797]
MTAYERPDLGPAARDAERWETYPNQKIIICLARTPTSAITVRELMRVFNGDDRVKVLYAVSPGSRFQHGAVKVLRDHKVDLLPYEALVHARCDLLVTTSEKVDFTAFPGTPGIVVPHGLGFHKFVPDADGPGNRLSGLVDDASLRTGVVTQLVTHPDQVRQLEHVTAHIAGRTVLGGDMSFDLLSNSVVERDVYRRALGLAPGQHLVTFSSTWGKGSLSARASREIERALAELPVETYKVALTLHPNVWSLEGEDNVRRRFHRHVERGGLVLVDPVQGWHAVFVASSLVIADNGSLSLYAAMMGTPLLIGAFSDQVVPGTAMEHLGTIAPRLTSERNLRHQVEEAIAGKGKVDPHALIERTIALPGKAAESFRRLCFHKLGLVAPTDELPVWAAPAPIVTRYPVRSYEVRTLFVEPSTITLQRFPAAVKQWCEPVEAPWERHLAAYANEPDLRVRQNAAILVDEHEHDFESATARLRSMRENYPGCRIVVVKYGSRHLAAVRRGSHHELTAEPGSDPLLLASALYALIVARRPAEGVFTLKAGASEHKLTISSSFGP